MENKSKYFGQIILLFILFILFLYYSNTPAPFTIIDGFNLAIHEAGHAIFYFLGEFMMFLGGTLTQLVVPLVLILYFLKKSSMYSAGFCLYWFGINLINVGIYAADATTMSLPLINDNLRHDWNYLLSQSGLIQFDTFIGFILRATGTITMVGALILMSWFTLQLYLKDLHTRPTVD